MISFMLVNEYVLWQFSGCGPELWVASEARGYKSIVIMPAKRCDYYSVHNYSVQYGFFLQSTFQSSTWFECFKRIMYKIEIWTQGKAYYTNHVSHFDYLHECSNMLRTCFRYSVKHTNEQHSITAECDCNFLSYYFCFWVIFGTKKQNNILHQSRSFAH